MFQCSLMDIVSLLQLLPPLTPKVVQIYSPYCACSLALSLQAEFCQKEKNTTGKDSRKESTIPVHLFFRAAHCNSQSWILHTFTSMNRLKLHKCKSIRGRYFEAVVLFNEESLQAFLSVHFLLAADIATGSVHNSTVTEQTHSPLHQLQALP